MRFARKRGLPVSEVLAMHPRDMDTWILLDFLDEREKQTEAKFAELHAAR